MSSDSAYMSLLVVHSATHLLTLDHISATQTYSLN